MRPAVCVYDHSASRRAELSHLISECGAEPRIYPGDGLDTEAVSSSLGLVSIEPDFAALTLRAVRNLKKRDFDVLVVHAGPEPMSLADRCQALLAGASAVLEMRASDFVPATRRWIEDKIKRQILRAEETTDLRRTMRQMSIIGESPALVAAFSRLVKVSKLSDVPVLIQGESGTGKGLFAQALQRLDPKRLRAPFVSVNCAAISAQLIESELFGHRKGSFTGAERHRKGLIRSAEGGTLFLDEVGELDIAVQAKMLRVLQEKRVLGVGEDQEVPVDIRVVAATNRSLEEMVRERTFRADLYHRLNVVSISIPPLHGRPEDIAPLVQHFLSKHAGIAFDRNFEISREFIDALSQLELRGNARELENIIRQVLLDKGPGTELNLTDLPESVWRCLTQIETAKKTSFSEPTPAGVSSPRASTPEAPDLKTVESLLDSGATLSNSLQECEKILLQAALRQTHGNQSQTARLLGITPRSVYNKLRRHNLAA